MSTLSTSPGTVNDDSLLHAFSGAIQRDSVSTLEALVAVDCQLLNAAETLVAGAGSWLHLAAHSGAEAVTRWLVEQGLPLEGKNGKGQTPLVCAILGRTRLRDGTDAIVDVLLDMGANPEGAVGFRPPLHLAAMEYQGGGMLQSLLRKKVDIDNQYDGLTALMNAASYGITENIKLLLIAGANPMIRSNSSGLTAVDHAQHGGYWNSVDFLRSFIAAKRAKEAVVDVTNGQINAIRPL